LYECNSFFRIVMYSLTKLILVAILIKVELALCYTRDQINGINNFIFGQKDNKLFFDTPHNAALQKMAWVNGYKIDSFTFSLITSKISVQRTSDERLGMHHEVLTKLQIEWKGKEQSHGRCFALFAEQVTRSFFVDIYELQRQFSHQVYYNSSIDIEKPAYEASSHILLIIKELKFMKNMYKTGYVLPWHIRYHKPSENKYDNITLPPPQVYITCINFALNMEDTDKKGGIILAPCPDGLFSYSMQTGKKLCEWINVKVEVNNISFYWPVGSLSDIKLVTVGTLCVIIFSTFFLLLDLWQMPLNSFSRAKPK